MINNYYEKIKMSKNMKKVTRNYYEDLLRKHFLSSSHYYDCIFFLLCNIFIFIRMQVPHDYEFLSAAISNCECEVKSCVVGMATEDSYFMLHATKSITDFYNPDLPSVLVFLEYLIQTEVKYIFSLQMFDVYIFYL